MEQDLVEIDKGLDAMLGVKDGKVKACGTLDRLLVESAEMRRLWEGDLADAFCQRGKERSTVRRLPAQRFGKA